ncbi:glucosamine-6-phosphate deaminase [Tundrisphaera lichenicola]|uniref:glucosamine-6-phosphate deaminase n=1 Tax=Tundrisphaera lichenicola TaxID=2029860 RepID=UPI003EBBF3CC
MSKPIRRLELAGASVSVYSKSTDACQVAAERISGVISKALAVRGHAVLGLATGSTPEPVYARLVEAYREGILTFAKVSTYNLDEYYPMGPLDPQSYRTYMHRHLFGHVDLGANRAHLLDGTVPEAFAPSHAADFDRWIEAEGGLDLQLLGVGRNGHIGFNEPTDLPVEQVLALPTRLVDLHPTTISDAAKDFGGEDRVPRQALTVGIAPILAARSILVLAFGDRKAGAVARSLRGPITGEVPGSLLQTVPGKVEWLIDEAAGAEIL